jgi:hypothetical protein
LETAGLRDAEKAEIVTGASLAKRARDLPLDCQVPNRSLGSVVVPWYVVILEEGKKRFLIALKPFPVSSSRVSCGSLAVDRLSIETVYSIFMLPQVVGLQSKSAPPTHTAEEKTV